MNIIKECASKSGEILGYSVEYRILKMISKPYGVFPPIDPYSYFTVSPAEIQFQTGREQPWKNREDSFGTIQPGTWDKDPVNYAPSPNANQLYSAKSFEETIHFHSLRDRFIHGYDWEETELINIVKDAVKSGDSAWHGCQTLADIETRCKHVDSLYLSIKQNGLMPLDKFKQDDRGFLSTIKNEIMVDVGRDGELLFAHGRHRLTIAKLLEVPSVPIVIGVRHSEWTKKRRGLYNEGNHDHPDVPDISSYNILSSLT